MGRRFGGKRKAGGRGGKAGKGRGGGKRRRRSRAEAGEAEGPGGEAEAAVLQPRGGGKARRRGSQETVSATAAEPEEAPPAASAEGDRKSQRIARPGFETLLQCFGVADSDPEEEDAEANGEEDGPEGAAGESEEKDDDDDERGDGKEEDVDLEEQHEDEEDEEEDDDDEVWNYLPGQGTPAEADASCGLGSDRLEFFSRFWEDPPRPLAARHPAPGGRDAADGGRDETGHFALPGLSRCESRRRDVGSLLAQTVRTSAEAAAILRRCELAPGMRQAFEELLTREGVQFGPQEGVLLLFLHTYMDVAFPQHTHLNTKTVRAACALHAADHVLKARHEVRAHSAAANSARRKGTAEDVGAGPTPDMGFTRPRVLILCPFRSVAHEIVQIFLALCPGTKHAMSRNRFEAEFGDDAEENEEAATKSADWAQLFKGNSDDRFKIGLSVSGKGVKLYAPFDKSDVLICSPLGLRQITGAGGERRRDFDFLSSIELCIVDRADALRMQNWEHVQEVMQVVNRRPQGLKGIDISRLRPEFAEGKARAFRQTVVTSAGQSLDVEALFNLAPSDGGGSLQAAPGIVASKLRRRPRLLRGGRGLARRADSDDEDEGEEEVPAKLLPEAGAGGSQSCRGFVRLAEASAGGPLDGASALGVSRQFFLHVACSSMQERSDRLFQAFEGKYWRPLGVTLERLLVVATTYFDFLRLRRFFREEGASFCSAFEYSTIPDLTRARFRFFHGQRRVLLVTERFLWYRRYRLRGADYVLLYGPPETPELYEEILGGVRVPSQCNSMCLFTRQDGFAVERIVGHERAGRMLTSPPGKVFVFS